MHCIAGIPIASLGNFLYARLLSELAKSVAKRLSCVKVLSILVAVRESEPLQSGRMYSMILREQCRNLDANEIRVLSNDFHTLSYASEDSVGT